MKRKIYTLAFIVFVSSVFLFLYCFTCRHYFVSETVLNNLAGLDARESVDIPIIMYHSITDDPSRESEYVISSARFENDLLWLKENGFTTILPSQLIRYVKQGVSLPEKPVILSFDDGYYNNYSLAFPLLEKYSAKAVIAIIGSQSDTSSREIYRNPTNCSLSWGEAAIMSRSGFVEFANHSYKLHEAQKNGRKGADMLKGESFEQYRQVLLKDLGKNQAAIEKATGQLPQVFAWPYGAYPADRSADQVLKELGFDATFVSYQHTSSVKAGAPETLYGLGRWLRTPDFDMNSILPH